MEGDDQTKIMAKIRAARTMLINTREKQLVLMAQSRKKNIEGFAFFVTPDLVLQYNYVHHLIKSFYTHMPPDICVQDGGVMCCNLSMLGEGDFQKRFAVGSSLEPQAVPVATGTDYVAARIVDLLDRPIAGIEKDLTLNVRDEFAANIATLNLLFEERYKMCQEEGHRLKTELMNVKQQLAVSRSVAAADTPSGSGTEQQTVERMRNQIAQYDVKLRTVRQHVETLRNMNDQSIKRIQEEVDELMRRVNESGRTDQSALFIQFLQHLFDTLENEREHVVTALEDMQLLNDKRKTEFSTLLLHSRSIDDQFRQELEKFSEKISREYLNMLELLVNLEDRKEKFTEKEFQELLNTAIDEEKDKFEQLLNNMIEGVYERFGVEVDKEVDRRMAEVEPKGVGVTVSQEDARDLTTLIRENQTKSEEINRLKEKVAVLVAQANETAKGVSQNQAADQIKSLHSKIVDLEYENGNLKCMKLDVQSADLAKLKVELESEKVKVQRLKSQIKDYENLMSSEKNLGYKPISFIKKDVEKKLGQISAKKHEFNITEQSTAFRNKYNELAKYVINVIDDILAWARRNMIDEHKLPVSIREGKVILSSFFKTTDKVIGYGQSPALIDNVIKKARGQYFNPSGSKTSKHRAKEDEYRPKYGRSEGANRWESPSPD